MAIDEEEEENDAAAVVFTERPHPRRCGLRRARASRGAAAGRGGSMYVVRWPGRRRGGCDEAAGTRALVDAGACFSVDGIG